MSPDVVLVGAGPVGLFTAIELKLLNPELNILILERNKEYTRHHILRLEKESLVNSVTYNKYEKVRELHGFVPTSQIEQTFMQIATELGIQVQTDHKVVNPEQILENYPSAHTVIGADGARSIVRKQLFQNRIVSDDNLQYIIEIKYQVEGKTKRLPGTTYGPALGQVGHLVSENIGKQKEGITPVSLFVFVNEETYNLIRKQQNAKIAELDRSEYPIAQLLNTILPWLSLRHVAVHEKMIADSEKINGVALNVYHSECFAKQLGQHNVYLVGDAAAAVPYFRALNAGLLSAQVTAKAITSQQQPDLEQLNKELTQLATKEIRRAYKNNKQVNVGRGLNAFLFNASKFTTGAVLRPQEETAMLNARIQAPHFLRRHPRFFIGSFLFIVLSLVLIPAFLPIFSLASSALIAIASAAAVVTFLVLSVKIADVIKNYLDPISPSTAFPWENKPPQNDNSNNKKYVEEEEPGHYAPLFTASVAQTQAESSVLTTATTP